MLGLARPLLFVPSLLVSIAATLATLGCGSGGSGGTGGAAEPPPFKLPAQVYAHGDPSALDQALLEEVQRSRADPPAAGERIAALPEVQNAIKDFGVDKQQLIADFAGYPPVPPFAFDPHLLASSRVHSLDMADNGFQEHDGSAGDTFSDRISSAGYDYSFIEENIFAYAKSIPYCNAALLIDWGNPDLGHRSALLDLDGAARDIGVSVIEKPNGPNGVGPLVVTEDFGQPLSDPRRYIVGVAYRDENQNGLYDAGEGVAGLNVVPASGDTYAVTGASGGYAIPFSPNPKTGSVKVQIQSAAGAVLHEGEVTLAGVNVKIDFVLE
jgi:uncharacterized protein YkwD